MQRDMMENSRRRRKSHLSMPGIDGDHGNAETDRDRRCPESKQTIAARRHQRGSVEPSGLDRAAVVPHRGAFGVATLGKVLIVGGSVAGMSCAIQLRKAGIAVDLIDIDPNWRTYGAGITITGPTLRALKTLGVLEQVTELGAVWNGAKVFDQSGRLLEDLSIPPVAPDLPGTGGIMRPALHKILSSRTRALGANVRLGLTVAALKQHSDRVEVQFSDSSRDDYALVVGADGIFSAIRALVFPEAAKPQFTGQVIYRIVAERPPGFDRTHFFMGPGVKVGFNPVSTTHMYMFLLHADPTNPRRDPKDMPRLLHEKLAGFGGMVPQVRETVLGANAHTINYRALDALLLPRPWYRGRVLLIGDAAHATTPHLAAGAGIAIEDSLVLAEELAGGGELDQALLRFMERRFERCRLVVESSVKLGQIEMSHGSTAEHGRLMTETLAALRQPI
jgi:2-polyprenyl-6-methoxyphenol hydroxylase-like FAD-dependent oxidoreductase